MELYINNSWTERCGKAYMAEAIAWSDSGNHVTIYAVGSTADEANTKLANALHELKLILEASTKGDMCSLTNPRERACEGAGGTYTQVRGDKECNKESGQSGRSRTVEYQGNNVESATNPGGNTDNSRFNRDANPRNR